MAELLVRGAYLFDVAKPLTTGDILVRDGLIAEIAPRINAATATVIDARNKIVMPGFVNAHMHSNQALEKGLNDRYPLDTYMLLGSYGGANAEFRPRDLYVSAMVGAIEMIRGGATSAIDMPRVDMRWFREGTDAIMQAYADIGMRAMVAVTYTDLNFPGSLPLELVPGAAEALKPRKTAELGDIFPLAESFINKWRGWNPLLVPAIGPSSLPRCSTELFEASVDFAKAHGVHMQTHLLSAKSQVFVGQKRYGGSTVEFLNRIGCLEDWASYAHSIWLDPREVMLFAHSPACAVHNPISNSKLGVGTAPIIEMRKAGGRIAIGSDGSSSADGQNMFETIKSAANVHRASHRYEDWILAEDALDMCWNGGAVALGQRLGRLEPSYAADLMLLHTRHLFITPKEQLAGQMVHSELGSSVDTMIIGGEVVFTDNRFTRIDEAAIHAEAQEILTRVYSGMPERERKFAELYPMFRDLERAVADAHLPFTRFCG
jgi:5-methylthioadenosine/S-adenosylhomocysteine deaminase